MSAIFFNQEEGCEFDQFTLFGWWADLSFVVMSWEIGMDFGIPLQIGTRFPLFTNPHGKIALQMSGLLVALSVYYKSDFKCKSATEK